MNRFYAAQDGHIVPLIFPRNITGGVTSPAFSLKNYSHASIVLVLGAQAAANTDIILNACTNASGAGATPIAFDLFAAETSNVDLLTVREAQTASGYAPSANADIFYVIEIDTQQLPQGYPYLQLEVTNGANANYASAVAILSGARYGGDQSPTVLV
jgi:hypothetical protein